MFVYFIATQGCNPRMVKIGKAKNVDSRVLDLQCACPFELELRGTLKCSSEKHAYKVENDLHHAFRNYRRKGEWFLYTLEVKYAIDSIIKDQAMDRFVRHIFLARSNRTTTEKEESEAVAAHNALDREYRAIMG